MELLVANNWNTTADNSVVLNEQSFRYEYDARRRLTMKKVPGSGEMWMVYDKWDRLVLMQDANLRPNQKWLFTKYDYLNRPIMTGWFTNATYTTQSAMQGNLNSQNLARFEIVDLTKTYGYTTQLSFPSTGFPDPQTITFYDNYDWTAVYGSGFHDRDNDSDPMFFTADNNNYPYPQPLTTTSNTRGMITGSWTKALGTSKAIVKSIFYDDKGRTVQVKSNNITGDQSNPTSIFTTQYDFSGQPLAAHLPQTTKGDASQHTLFVMTTYNYDDLGRPVEIKKWLDAYTPEGHILVPEKPLCVMNMMHLAS
ncbi:hypothetical protein [Paraflavitalea speifideaquila]|uniref:hypothetical protein n=1 Tax=Paraflavitalea speifideaquila TaxID=3076558 RepID=UPI0028E9A692|nr:hypothetical protein [Paraflavitalea speifideiaquila]